MSFCRNCGKKLNESDAFCFSCGAKQELSAEGRCASSAQQASPIIHMPVRTSSGSVNVGLLIWSIFNLIFGGAALGIVSLVMTILASSATTLEDEEQKLKVAKICNLIASILIALVVFFYAAMFILIMFVPA